MSAARRAAAARSTCKRQPAPVAVAALRRRRLRRAEPRQGRDRPGHRHRAGADRRRRARRRACPHPHGPGDDGAQPQRGHHLGQPVGASIRGSARALRRRRRRARSILAAAAQRLGVPPRTPRGRGRHHRRARQPAHQLLGACRRGSARPRRHRRAAPKPAAARRIAGTPAAAPRPARQGVRPAALHPRSAPARHAARPRAAARRAGRAADGARRRGRARGCRASSPWSATAASPASSPRPRHAAEAALARLRKGAGMGRRARRCPTRASSPAWLKSQPVETTTVDERKAAAPAAVARTDPAGSTRGRSSPMPRSRRPAPSRSGPARTRCRSGRTARASTICAPTSRSRWRCRRRASSSSTSRAPAATATTAPTTWRSTPCCWRARRSGRPVRVQWSREDELAWSPFGAAMAVEIEADLDARRRDRRLAPRRVEQRPRLAARARDDARRCSPRSQLAKPFERFIAFNPPLATGGGAERNAVPLYDLPACEITCHRLLTMPIRTSALRTLGAFANVFAIESFLDELAAERGEDPLAFRLRHLKDPRARAVLEAAAERAGWSAWRQARGRRPRHRLCPLQELRRLLRRRGRGRGRRRHPRAAAGGRRRRRRGRSTPTASPTRSRAAPSRPRAGR